MKNRPGLSFQCIATYVNSLSYMNLGTMYTISIIIIAEVQNAKEGLSLSHEQVSWYGECNSFIQYRRGHHSFIILLSRFRSQPSAYLSTVSLLSGSISTKLHRTEARARYHEFINHSRVDFVVYSRQRKNVVRFINSNGH